MKTISMRIGLVAHDKMKTLMGEWVSKHSLKLKNHILFATGTTAKILTSLNSDINVTALKSGPLGGDQQLGAMIANGVLDMLIFFQDPMTPQPHDVDIKALIRLAVVYDIPIACNHITAEYLIESSLFGKDNKDYKSNIEAKYIDYLNRNIQAVENQKS